MARECRVSLQFIIVLRSSILSPKPSLWPSLGLYVSTLAYMGTRGRYALSPLLRQQTFSVVTRLRYLQRSLLEQNGPE